MRVTIKTSFKRDVKKYRNKELKQKIVDLILVLEDISDFATLPDFKKLRGHKHSYRIAFQYNSIKYRICMNIIDDEICIERFLKRNKNTYKLFP